MPPTTAKRTASPARWLALALLLTGCATAGLRTAVPVAFEVARGTPEDALVIVDEEIVGPLGYVARRGVRVSTGEHRVSVQKEGYFPWDALVTADRGQVRLAVKLERIPD